MALEHDGTVGGCALWLQHALEHRGAWRSDRRAALADQLVSFARLYMPDPLPLEHASEAVRTSAHLGEALSRASDLVYAYRRQPLPLDAAQRLRTAAETGDVALAQSSRGAAVDQSDLNGTTALMAAALHGHATMVSWLLASGANPRLQDVFGDSYLQHGY